VDRSGGQLGRDRRYRRRRLKRLKTALLILPFFPILIAAATLVLIGLMN
jgi:uncharacterized membrane protein